RDRGRGGTPHRALEGEALAAAVCRCAPGVAPTKKHPPRPRKNTRRTSRAGKSRQPSQSFFACRQIFILLAVGARHHKTVEVAPLELAAQLGNACRALRALARVVK